MRISPSPPPISPPQMTAAIHRNIFHLTRRLYIAGGFMFVGAVCALSISLMFIFHYYKTRVRDIESRFRWSELSMPQPQTASAATMVAYREMKAEKITGGGCAICIEGFVGEDKCGVVENCSHFFHKDCIDRWLKIESSCPLCRCFVVS